MRQYIVKSRGCTYIRTYTDEQWAEHVRKNRDRYRNMKKEQKQKYITRYTNKRKKIEIVEKPYNGIELLKIDNKNSKTSVGYSFKKIIIRKYIYDDGSFYELECGKCGRIYYAHPEGFSRQKSNHCSVCNNIDNVRSKPPEIIIMQYLKQYRIIWNKEALIHV